MNIQKATQLYEKWLSRYLNIIAADIGRKHSAMAEAVYPFLRATFYRWCQLWSDQAEELSGAPRVLAVGDLHVENFGTWRDTEGRLAWGVNDFDEACELPYTFDLVRLAASAVVAIEERRLAIDPEEACARLLAAYSLNLKEGGRPIVLAEHHSRLRRAVTGVLRDPVRFWERLQSLPRLRPESVPASARKALERMLPERRLEYRVHHRAAGLGSLGRERYLAIAEHRGGLVAREAKALAPSACVWAGLIKKEAIRYRDLLGRAVRNPDPYVKQQGRWIVRRLAPDCCRIELGSLEAGRDEVRLLEHMGYETANVHRGTPGAAGAIVKDLGRRRKGWLLAAVEALDRGTRHDWEDWRAVAKAKAAKKEALRA
jgi:hypothetical protein